MSIVFLFLATLFLSYTNGANDNFKGVATLYGSNILSYKTALGIATAATFVGSIAAIFLANGLIASFSGKGLVPPELAGTTDFLIAVGFGAGATVLLATRLGFPISTTHSLVGALFGAGFMAVGWKINLFGLGKTFFVPLLVSPFIAFALGLTLYTVFTKTRKSLGLTKTSCICYGQQQNAVLQTAASGEACSDVLQAPTTSAGMLIGDDDSCKQMYAGSFWGFPLQKLLDGAHILSAAAVSFARGLNDTPKIAGLLVAAQVLDIRLGMIAVASAMAIGGLLNARRVAETMSHSITTINHGQGFAANLSTSFLVIIASKFGVPVSTTHVSVGSLFGIGVVSGKAHANVIRSIILSWVITLPVAICFSAAIYGALSL